MKAEDGSEPISVLSYGGATLPNSDNPPPSYQDRVESLLALSRARRAGSAIGAGLIRPSAASGGCGSVGGKAQRC